MPVRDFEGEGIGKLFAHAQTLHHGQGIVQGVGIIAAGVYAQRAVEPQRGGLRHETHHIMQIRIHRRGQFPADSGRILKDGGRGRGQHGHVVSAVDGHGQGVGGRAAVPVRDFEGEGIGKLFPYSQALHHGQGIVQGVGVITRGVHRKRAVEPQCGGLRHKTHHIMQIRIHRRGQFAADAGRIFDNGGRGRSHRGQVVSAVDGQGQSVCGRAAVIVRHSEGEGVGEFFTHAQALHRGQRVVQSIGVIAAGIYAQRAVEPQCGGLRHETHHIMQVRVHRHGQRAADADRVLDDGSRSRPHTGQIVGAVDSQRQRIGNRAAVPVRHRKHECIGEFFTHAQTLHHGQGIIQGVGIMPGNVQSEFAVTAHHIALGDERQDIMDIRIRGHRQIAADADRILKNHGCGRGHRGRLVAAADAHGHNSGSRAAVSVGHGDRKGVGQAFAGSQALHHGQRGVQGIGIVAVGTQSERAVTARRIGLRGETDHIVHIRIRGQRQRAAGNGAVFGNAQDCRDQHGRVVGAVDGQGQAIASRAPVAVGNRETERVGEFFSHAQALHHGQGIVQDVGIIARGVHRKCAVQAYCARLRQEGQYIVHVHIHRHGQRAADAGRILGDHGRGRADRGNVVGAVDGQGQRIGNRAPVTVGNREAEGVDEFFTHAQALHRRQRVVQGVGVVAVGVQGERTVQARLVRLRKKSQHVVQVHIHRRGQRAADSGRAFGDHGCGRAHAGQIIGAVDGQGQRIGGRASVAVGNREAEGVGELFTHAQALHRGQGIVQDVGVVAVGVHGELAVQTRCARLRQEGQHIMHVHIHGHGQRAADADRILRDHGRGHADRGYIVGAVDGQGQSIGNRAAVPVRHRKRESVGECFPNAQALHRGQRIIQDVGVIAVGIQRKRAVQARLVRLREKGQHVMQVHVHGHGQGAADADRILRDHGCGRADCGYVVGAVNGQGQGIGNRAAVPVRHGKGKGVGEMFPDAQGLHRGQRIIQDIGIVAVGVHGELAVQAHCARLREKGQHIVQVHIHGHGQGAADADRILGDHGRGHADRGYVVGAVDGHGQGIGDRAAKPVGNREAEGVGEFFTHAQALHCRQRVVQGIDIAARGIHRERAVEPHRGRLGQIADDIEQAGVCRRGQQPGNIDAVLGDHIYGRFHAQAAAAPGNRDGQGIGGCAPMPVRHGIGECFREMLVEQQIDHGEQACVQGIHIGTVGIEGQPAVAAELIDFGNEGHGVADIRVRGSDEMTRVGNIRLGNRGSGGPHRRRVISAVDGQGQGVRGRAAVAVRDSKGKGIGELVAHAQALHRRQCVVQGVAVIA